MIASGAAPRAWLALALGLAGCRAEQSLPEIAPATIYPARVPAWPAAPWTGRIGRGTAPAALSPAPVVAAMPLAPLAGAALWAVPGDGPARVVVSGSVDGAVTVERIDIDAGVVRWRSDRCPGPVVHVVAGAAVCAAGDRVVGLGDDDGGERWQLAARFVAATGDLLIAGDAGSAVVLDAGAGTEAARFALPTGVAVDDLVGACRRGGAVEVWAWSGGRLSRLEVRGAAAAVVWSAPVEAGAARPRIDPCDEVVVVEADVDAGVRLTAVDRRDGRTVGGPVVARGRWPAREGAGLSIELASDGGIERRSRALAAPVAVGTEVVGRLVASRGARRLVEAAGGFVLLEPGRATAIGAPAGSRAVLGEHHLVLAPPPGRGGLERWQLAPASSPPVAAPVRVDPDERRSAHLADLPPLTAVDLASAVALPAAGRHGVAGVAVDPDQPAWIYAAPVEQPSGGPGLAQLDVRDRRWRWYTADGCPDGALVAIAVDGDTVLCATDRGLRAVARDDGAVRWTLPATAAITAVSAAAGVAAVSVGPTVVVVDTATGAELGRFADDGRGPPRVVVTRVGAEPLLIAAERGGVVARAPRIGMLPRWAVRVDGAVTQVAIAGDRALVSLATGELYLLDAATGDHAVAAGGFAAEWRAPGGADLVVREQRSDAWYLAAYGRDGVARFRTGLAGDAPWRLRPDRGRDPGSPLVATDGASGGRAAVIDPVTGVVTRAVEAAAPGRGTGLGFGTAVDGAGIAGVVLAQPLAIALF